MQLSEFIKSVSFGSNFKKKTVDVKMFSELNLSKFPFQSKIMLKKLMKLVRCGKVHSFQSITDIESKF